MMKKLLVLALVLGMAVVANAGIVTTTLVDNALEARVDTDLKTIEFFGLATVAGSNLSVTGLALSFQATVPDDVDVTYAYLSGKPFLGTGFGPWIGDDWAGYSMSGDTTGTFGSLAKFSYDAGLENVAKFTIYNDDTFGASEVSFRNSPTVNMGGMVIVPEPMTMLLLGLGGLFLRKK